ncbi:MAG: Ig-like domain-containing protein [Clostridiales bacterium]|jgi:uncharacterized protein YjdB|nr:Ig-like domain-containing protein [Clostridiales bacterium]
MKKALTRYLAALAVLTLSLSAAACGNKDGGGGAPAVVLSETEKTVFVGDSFRLSASVENTADAVVWSTSDIAVAGVGDDGTVTAYAPGAAYIYATAGNISARCAVTAQNSPYPVLDASVNSRNVYVGFTRQINARVTFEGNPLDPQPDIQYSSSAGAVAEVSASGLITGVSEGGAVISVSASHGGRSLLRAFDITVLAMTMLSLSETARISMRDEIYEDDLPQSAQIDCTGVIDGAVLTDPSQLTWTSGDPSVAEVSDTGVITGVSPGATSVTASRGSQSASCDVTVSAQERVAEFNYFDTEAKRSGVTPYILGNPGDSSLAGGGFTYFTDAVGGRTPARGGFMKASLTVTNKGGSAEGIRMRLDSPASTEQLQSLYARGYRKIIIPIYMKYTEDFPADTAKPVYYRNMRELSAPAALNNWTAKANQSVGYIHEGRWNNWEYDLGWVIQLRALFGQGIDLVVNCYKTDEGGNTNTDIYVDGMYAVRPETTIVSFGYDDHTWGSNAVTPYTGARAAGASGEGYEIGAIGGREPSGVGFIKFTHTKAASNNGNVVFSYTFNDAVRAEAVSQLKILLNAGYGAVKFPVYLRFDGASGGFTLEDTTAPSTPDDPNAGGVIAASLNTSWTPGYAEGVYAGQATLTAGEWKEVKLPIDWVIKRMDTEANGGLNRPTLFSWRVNNAAAANFSLFVDAVTAVKLPF